MNTKNRHSLTAAALTTTATTTPMTARSSKGSSGDSGWIVCTIGWIELFLQIWVFGVFPGFFCALGPSLFLPSHTFGHDWGTLSGSKQSSPSIEFENGPNSSWSYGLKAKNS